MILKAIEKEDDKLIWEKWLAFSPHMDEQKAFSDYRAEHFNQDNSITNTKSDDEIIKDAESILSGKFKV